MLGPGVTPRQLYLGTEKEEILKQLHQSKEVRKIAKEFEQDDALQLDIVRCECKASQCRTSSCSCRKFGLRCVSACLHCRGENCENVEELVRVDEVEDLEDKDDELDDPDFGRNIFNIFNV